MKVKLAHTHCDKVTKITHTDSVTVTKCYVIAATLNLAALILPPCQGSWDAIQNWDAVLHVMKIQNWDADVMEM